METNKTSGGGDSVVNVEKEEEPTMVVRVLSVAPPQGLAFRFADGHVEPITAIMAVPGETLRETLERLAKDLGAELVTQMTSEDSMIHPRPRSSSCSDAQRGKKAIA